MSTDRWHVEVSHDCIGSGMCAGAAPEFFRLVDGYAEPVHTEIDPAEVVTDAADQCPAEAISVVDVASGKTLAPVD
ncbi:MULTISPECIES: ferredoxin [unclassified Crossiella]|uniref:ferredoxin n=1 Tax=unclassified Crossiella TaxID=2620835 RepID=UPI001FFF3907|nr:MULTISPECIES: ferredoxin [unclassified Crossiella]MCK2241121.1 ferredoxin [Crossiella sp. S99.2]MCK2253735.1 ferredoxin [Crossiella sp. S99.1]